MEAQRRFLKKSLYKQLEEYFHILFLHQRPKKQKV